MLEVECHQRPQWLSVGGWKAVEDFLDGGLKVSERRMVAPVECAAFDELPQAFDQVQVRRVRRQEEERDPQLFRRCLNGDVALIPGIVQHHRDRSGQPQRGGLPQ